jgi:hypothetical protein
MPLERWTVELVFLTSVVEAFWFQHILTAQILLVYCREKMVAAFQKYIPHA